MGDTRMQNHAELLADRLVAPTLGLAVGTAALSADFGRFLSLVIVDYGTGIRVAAPTSVLSSMTHAARAGIVIKSGGHMEKLAKVDTIVFDKTGHPDPRRAGRRRRHRLCRSHHARAICSASPRRRRRGSTTRSRRRCGPAPGNCWSTSRPATRPITASASASRARSTATTSMSAASASCASQRHPSRPPPLLDRAALDRNGYSVPLHRGRRQARRPRRLCRQGAAGKPPRHRPAARNGHPQHHHADRRQCGGGEGGQRAASA